MRVLYSLLVIVLILALLIAARNIIFLAGLKYDVQRATGLRLEAGRLDLGLLKPTLDIENLTLYNPAGYQDPLMAQVGEIEIYYQLHDLLKGVLHFNKLRLTLNELFIINSKTNQLNTDNLGGFRNSKGKAPELVINGFFLDIGTVVYKDYVRVPPLVKTYRLDIKEHYSGIYDFNILEQMIWEGILNKTSISSLIKGDIKKLGNGVSSTLLNGLQVSDDSIKDLLNSL